MKPILIHCHIFNTLIWDELKACLLNVTQFPYVLYVTFVEKHPDIVADINATFPGAKIEIVEGRGFDVGPFVHVINEVNLDDFSYIVKLHTKRDLKPWNTKFRNMHSDRWRNNLLLPYRSQEIFRQYIENFEKYTNVGMQGCYKLFVKNNYWNEQTYDKYTKRCFKEFLKSRNLNDINFMYLAGTMFIARAHLFKYLQNLHLTLQNFTPSNRDEKGDLAHVFERFFGYMIYTQGYVLRDTMVAEKVEQKFQRQETLRMVLYRLSRFFYEQKITNSGYRIVKILRVPVLHLKEGKIRS